MENLLNGYCRLLKECEKLNSLCNHAEAVVEEKRVDIGICPVTERMHEKEFFSHERMRPGMKREDLDDVVTAFEKVYEYPTEW